MKEISESRALTPEYPIPFLLKECLYMVLSYTDQLTLRRLARTNRWFLKDPTFRSFLIVRCSNTIVVPQFQWFPITHLKIGTLLPRDFFIPSTVTHLTTGNANAFPDGKLPSGVQVFISDGIAAQHLHFPKSIREVYLELFEIGAIEFQEESSLEILHIEEYYEYEDISDIRLEKEFYYGLALGPLQFLTELYLGQYNYPIHSFPPLLKRLTLNTFNKHPLDPLPTLLEHLSLGDYTHRRLQLHDNIKCLLLGEYNSPGLLIPAFCEMIYLIKYNHPLKFPDTVEHLELDHYSQPFLRLPQNLIFLDLLSYQHNDLVFPSSLQRVTLRAFPVYTQFTFPPSVTVYQIGDSYSPLGCYKRRSESRKKRKIIEIQ